MDISEAKNIFFSCYGSKFCIDREYGDEYRKYNVPDYMEKEWLNDIQKELYCKINSSFGCEQSHNVSLLCLTLEAEKSAKLLMDLLNDMREDSFTRLLYCEQLVKLIRDIKTVSLKESVVQEVWTQMNYILSNLQDIDEKYKQSKYLQDSDFSNENLLERVYRMREKLK